MRTTTLMLFGAFILASCGKGSSENKQPSAYIDQSYSDHRQDIPDFDKYGGRFKTIDFSKDSLKADDLRYNSILVTRNKNKKVKNFITFEKGLRNIKLLGKEIVLSSNHKQQFLKSFNKASDVESLLIQAENLIVEDIVHLPGTNITIQAKRITFKGDAKFITTPNSSSAQTPQFQNGRDGERGGDIDLIIEEIIQDTPMVRFITNGGNGEDAGAGANGARGTNPSIIVAPNYYMSQIEKCKRDTSYGHMDRGKSQTCTWKKNTGARAGNGKNARVGGKPGEPGDAGVIGTSVDIDHSSVEMKGGKAGKVDSVRIGGQPGSPAHTCVYVRNRRRKVSTRSCATAVKGQDAQPKKAKREIGQSGLVEKIFEDETWVTDSYVTTQTKFLNDVFLAGNNYYAQNLINELKVNLAKVKTKSLTMEQAQLEIQQLQGKLDMDLDYFGNKRGWVPNLAFEVNYKIFESEVKRNIKLLYLTHQIKKISKRGIIEVYDLEQLQKLYVDEIDLKSNQISKLVESSILSNELIDELKVARSEFQFELNKLEKEIARNARNNLKPKFMDKAVKFFAAASKAIPVGQPAFAATGAGLEFIHNATSGSMSTSEILKEIPGIYETYKGVNFKKSLKELDKAMDELSPRHLPSLRTNKEKKEYFNKVKNFTSPIISAVSAQIEEHKKRGVSKSALNAEIEKLKRKNAAFQSISKKLNTLLLKKEKVIRKVQKTLADIAQLQTDLNKSFVAIAYLYDGKYSLINNDFFTFVEKMDNLYSNALKRIQYYDYLLNKSFSYRFLINAPKAHDLSIEVEKMLKLLDDNTSYEVGIEKMWVSYNNSISNYIETIVKDYENKGQLQSMSLDLVLTQEELATLNENKEIFINLVDRDLFGENKENIRIQNIEALNQISFHGSRGNFQLETVHLGKSLIDRGNKTFYFDLSGEKDHFVWNSEYSATSNNLYNSKSAQFDFSLLNHITQAHTEIKQAFAFPGARGFIKLKLFKDKNVKLKKLMLRVDYTYQRSSK